jgi:hypothetical protein
MPAGTAVKWTAAATGGTGGPLQFKFILYDQRTRAWTVLQDFGPSNRLTWTTTTADAGLYLLQVWVKTASTSGAYDDWNSSGYFFVW